jgi:hypothetical protein
MSSGCQEIFAEFVGAVKESKAQWCSIKPVQSDAPTLADLLDISVENPQTLPVKSGFRKLGPNNKSFSFQASKFEVFRSSFAMQGACKTTHGKLKGTKTKEWCVRLGSQHAGDLAEPGTGGRAPRVNNIRATRKCFRDVIAKTQQQTEADQPREEESKEDDETEEEGAHSDPFENDLVLLRVGATVAASSLAHERKNVERSFLGC